MEESLLDGSSCHMLVTFPLWLNQASSPLPLSLLLVLFLTLVNGFFSAAEMAIINLNDNKIKRDAEAGDRFSKKLLALMEKPGNFLSTIQVGVTLAGFLSSAFAGDYFGSMLYSALDPSQTRPYLHGLCILLITLLISYITLVFGELVPKRIALNFPERVARLSIDFIRGFDFIMHPFTRFLTFSSNLILKLLGIRADQEARSVTEEEIRLLIDVGSSSGEIHSEESLMLQNVFEFNDKEVSEIMVHRKDIVGLPIDSTLEEVLLLAREEGYTRLPIYEEQVDSIVGVLNIKDLLFHLGEQKPSTFQLRELMRAPYYTPETKHIDALFREMQKAHEALAIVIDEYGGVAGLVTLEDLIEEIVGNIQDEYDEELPEIIAQQDGTYTIDGRADLGQLERHVEGFYIEDEESDYDTVAGLFLDKLGRIPDENEHPIVEHGPFTLELLEMDDKRIARLKLSRKECPEETTNSEPVED